MARKNNIKSDFFFYYNGNLDITDLYPIECGEEKCDKEKAILSTTYNYFAIHCVFSGTGYYEVKNKLYKIEKNTIFCFFPGEKIKYYPDRDDPWEYRWVNFLGTKAKMFFEKAGITSLNPIYKLKDECILNIFNKIIYANKKQTRDILVVAYLYEIFAKIIEEKSTETIGNASKKQKYILESLQYISQNYMNPELSVKKISSEIGLCEGYLSRTFKGETGLSIIQYINRIKLQKSIEYLEKTNYSNKEIAYLVGFNDSLYFSKIFKDYTNVSPKEYKKNYCMKKELNTKNRLL